MGYSCARFASMKESAIANICFEQTGIRNVWETKRGRYMFDVTRRENAGGAITGTIWKYVDENKVRKSGSFRIEPDGIVSRGPAFMRNTNAYFIRTMEKTRETIYPWEKSTKPTVDDLMEFRQQIHDSYKSDGVNAHISRSRGYMPTITMIEAVDIDSNQAVARYQMPMFEVV